MDLVNQHIAAKLNRAAEDARSMDDIERDATPLFYAVMAVIVVMALWTAITDYHDAQNTEAKQQYQLMSEVFARCANGDAVKFDDGWLVCKVKRFKVAAK